MDVVGCFTEIQSLVFFYYILLHIANVLYKYVQKHM